MPNAIPLFGHIGLLLALLKRWLGAWGGAKPPARFKAVMERTEATLADAIRATLREDGVAFPVLADAAFLKWFARDRPGSDKQAAAPLSRLRGRGGGGGCWRFARFGSEQGTPVAACGNTQKKSPKTDRRLPAGFNFAGWKPAVQKARAPPAFASQPTPETALAPPSAALGAGLSPG